MHENDTSDPTVRDTATVTVSEAVDGTKKRKRNKKNNQRWAINTTLTLDDVDPGIRAMVLKVKKPGQLVRIVSPTEVLVVNR